MKFRWFLFAILVHFSSTAETLNISFVVPDQERPTYFWHLVSEIAQSVAEDLDVELELRFSNYNRYASRTAIKSITNRINRPDYIIFRPFQGNAVEVFDLLESSEIPFVTLEQAFDAEEAKQLKKPGQKYKYWLGMVNYDDLAGGTLLTSALYKHHQKQNPNQTMKVTGLGGDFDQVSMDRQANLSEKWYEPANIKVNQVFPMDWSPDVVRARFAEVIKRYPNTDTFWCAGDLMAVEVVNQFNKVGWPADRKIIIGGFDWLPDALEKVNSRELTASVGGHFLMAGKAILKIVEYHHGNDVFTSQHALQQYELIDQDNIDIYLPFMRQAPWSDVDFRQFSAIKSGQKKTKELTVANLLKAYQQVGER